MDEAAMKSELSALIRERGVRPLAQEVGVSDAALHRWMQGQSTLAWSTLERVAAALGYEIERETTYRVRKREQAA